MAILTPSQLQAASNATYFDNVSGSITPTLVRSLNDNWISSSILVSQTSSMSVATASYFSGSISNAISSSYAETASYALNASSSFPYTGSAIISGSLTVTGSSFFRGSVTASGNLTVGMFGISIGNNGVSSNNFMGIRALESLTSTSISDGSNIAIGLTSLATLTAGAGNTAMGRSTLANIVSGSGNTAIGRSALFTLGSGSTNSQFNNVAVGTLAAINFVSGSQNIFIGSFSGEGLISGSGNTFIGGGTGSGSSAITATEYFNNNIIIGDGQGNTQLRFYSGSGWISSGSFNSLGGITGSLLGTASYALSSSYAATASVLLGSVVSASYALTASYINPLNQDVDITGRLYVSSSNLSDVVINGQVFVSASGNQAKITVSGSGGSSILTPSAILSTNGLGISTVAPNSVSNFSSAGDEIGFGANALSSSISGWTNAPAIYIQDTGGTYPAVIGFQGLGNYTDGRVTILRPLVVSGSTTVSGSLQVTNGITGSLQGTASYALTASYVNTLIQPVVITGSLDVSASGTTSIVANRQILVTGSLANIRVGGATSNENNTSITPGTFIMYNKANNTTAFLTNNSFIFQETTGAFINEISLAVNGASAGTTWPGPVIAGTDPSTNVYTIFGFQDAETYTDGRVTVLTPLIASSSIQVLNGITGSLLGTASYASQALSSSYAVTASYALNAGTSIDTGSFATTGSNVFNGNQTITGSVNIKGNISAESASFQYLTTVYETASVIYSSGSNQFGDAAGDVQTLYGTVDIKTGPLLVTGSINVSGGITGSLQGTASFAISSSNALTASFYGGTVVSASYAATASSVNTLNQNVVITGSLSLTGSGITINGDIHSTSSVNTIVGRTIIYGGDNTTTGATPRLIISGSDGGYSEFGRGFNFINTVKVSGVSDASGQIYANSGSVAGQYIGVFDDPNFNTDVEHAIIVSSSGVTLNDWDNGSTFAYVPYMTIAPNVGNNPTPQMKRGLSVTGSLNVSGGITGSLFGTASFAANAQTASYVVNALSSSYALTASLPLRGITNIQTASFNPTKLSVTYGDGSGYSFDNYALSSSYAITAGSASYALTASSVATASYVLTASFVNPLNQDVDVTGSIRTNAPVFINNSVLQVAGGGITPNTNTFGDGTLNIVELVSTASVGFQMFVDDTAGAASYDTFNIIVESTQGTVFCDVDGTTYGFRTWLKVPSNALGTNPLPQFLTGVEIQGNAQIDGNLIVKGGTNKGQDIVTLSSGSLIVSNSNATTTSNILLTKQTNAYTGSIAVSAKSLGQFTITSTNSNDNDQVGYLIINTF